MRVISGTCGGRIITPPRNLKARPTTDFAKENLFNVLGNMIDFERIDVLDLFAGTGSVSYEFASRGAESVTSVEINATHEAFIRTTAQKFGLSQIHPVKANAFLYLKGCSRRFDVIFADPPYDLVGATEIIDIIFERNLLKEEGLLIFEHSKATDLTRNPHFSQQRTYGSVNFSLFNSR